MITTLKTCFKCRQSKATSEFYRHPSMADGRLGKCKECAKRDAAANYRKNIDHYVEYERNRARDPERKKRQVAYHQSRDRAKQNATSSAIRRGKLTRKPCEVCGHSKVEAHHDDYSKPLTVRWLCRRHHLEHHGKVSRA